MQRIVNDVAIQYLDEGTGPVVLMLHGWRNDARSFDELAASLSSKFRVVRPDLPNFGQSGHTAAIHSLNDYAGFLRDFLDKLEIEVLYAVIGHSMGGQIALYASSTNAIAPERLILLASAGMRAEKRLRKTAIRASAKLAKPFVSQGLKDRLYKRIGSDYSSQLPAEQRAVLDEVLGSDIQGDARKVSVPTLLIYGNHDDATPPRHGQRLHELIAGSQLQTIEAGHHLHSEQPEAVAKLIKEFLK